MNVRAERIKRGLTLPAFARAAGVPYHVARRAEQNKPIREDSAKLLADYLGVDPLQFVEPPGIEGRSAA
jgi:transcriptional regulator with XRE-family HTH domain